jgi:hypothetical protein
MAKYSCLNRVAGRFGRSIIFCKINILPDGIIPRLNTMDVP